MICNSSSIRILAILAVAVPLWLTIPGDPAAALAADRTPWYCISCGAAGTADLFQNSLLLLPLGVVLAVLGWAPGRSALLLVLLPIGIEVTQGLMAAGRDAALGDVLANAGGGLLGWWIGRNHSRLLHPDQRRAAPLVWGIFVAQLMATAILGAPSPVGPEPWALRLNPEVPGRPAYRGTVEALTLGGRNILADPPPSKQLGSRNVGEFAAHFTWDPNPDPLPGTIARLDDARDWAVFSIDRRGDAVAITLRTLGARMRLREPTWMIVMPPIVAAGETVAASLDVHDGKATMSLESENSRAGLELPYGAQHGWVLINPFTPVHSSGPAWAWWTLAWLAGWGLLLGWFSSGGGRLTTVVWLALSLFALLWLTAMYGARATPPECVALAAGWSAALFSRRLLHRKPVAA